MKTIIREFEQSLNNKVENLLLIINSSKVVPLIITSLTRDISYTNKERSRSIEYILNNSFSVTVEHSSKCVELSSRLDNKIDRLLLVSDNANLNTLANDIKLTYYQVIAKLLARENNTNVRYQRIKEERKESKYKMKLRKIKIRNIERKSDLKEMIIEIIKNKRIDKVMMAKLDLLYFDFNKLLGEFG